MKGIKQASVALLLGPGMTDAVHGASTEFSWRSLLDDACKSHADKDKPKQLIVLGKR